MKNRMTLIRTSHLFNERILTSDLFNERIWAIGFFENPDLLVIFSSLFIETCYENLL